MHIRRWIVALLGSALILGVFATGLVPGSRQASGQTNDVHLIAYHHRQGARYDHPHHWRYDRAWRRDHWRRHHHHWRHHHWRHHHWRHHHKGHGNPAPAPTTTTTTAPSSGGGGSGGSGGGGGGPTTTTTTAPSSGGGGSGSPMWTSSAANGSFTTGGYTFDNNEWNSSHGPQTIKVWSAQHWGVTSTQSGTAVRTYPEQQVNYNKAWSSYSTISSSFAEQGPNTGDWEAAYDIWINGFPASGPSSTEVMIWTQNHGQRPAGSVVGTASIGGQTWQVWKGGSGRSIYSFVLNSLTGANESSGTVNLRAFFSYLASKGDISQSAPLKQINWGWEICSTGGGPATFTTTNYSLTTK